MWGEERCSDHQSYNPSEYGVLPQSVRQCIPIQSRCAQHLVPQAPGDSSLTSVGICKQAARLCACMDFLPLWGRLTAKNPREKFQLWLCKVSVFLLCSPRGARLHQPHTDQAAMSQRPMRIERHLPCFFSVCEWMCPPPQHTLPSSYLLWLCSYGALNTVPYLTRYLLMLTKCRVSVSQVVVQGTRPSSPSPMSHLLVSAAISRGTCSLVH